jgi:hypothetical protein
MEPGNLAAIESLRVFRALRWGRHVEVILTDNRSFRSEPVIDRPEVARFQSKQFPYVIAQEVIEILDAGRTYDGGRPPITIRFGDTELRNPRASSPPSSMLGGAQKKWFLERLCASSATWKVWGNSVATLDWRIDFQNLPADVASRWPASGYALVGPDDWSGYRTERAEILDFVRREGVAGLVSVAGDRHSFWAGVRQRATRPERSPNEMRISRPTFPSSTPAAMDTPSFAPGRRRWKSSSSASRVQSRAATVPTAARSLTASRIASSAGVRALVRDWSERLRRERFRSFSDPSRQAGPKGGSLAAQASAGGMSSGRFPRSVGSRRACLRGSNGTAA